MIAAFEAPPPIEGLTAKDFTVTEDGGERQTVSFVEFQRLPTTSTQAAPRASANASSAASATPPTPVAPPPAAAAGTVPSTTDARTASSRPCDIRYRKRLLVPYFDLPAMSPPDLLRAYNASRTFINTQMTLADLVAAAASARSRTSPTPGRSCSKSCKRSSSAKT